MVIRTFVSGDPGVGFQGPRGVMRKGVPGGQEGHLRGLRDSTGRCKKGDQQIYSYQGGQGAGKGRFQKLLSGFCPLRGYPPTVDKKGGVGDHTLSHLSSRYC